MATFLYRVGRTAYRRWPITIAIWLVTLLALGSAAAAFSKPLVDSFSIPGIPSEEAADLQAELFDENGDAFDAATVNVVVAAPEGQTLAEFAIAREGLAFGGEHHPVYGQLRYTEPWESLQPSRGLVDLLPDWLRGWIGVPAERE